jgi:predicted Zn-dependent protease
MHRTLAAILGCLLTISAGWAGDEERIAPTAPSVASDLPDLGGPATAMINKFDEAQIGRMEMNELRDQNMILEDAEVTDYLQQLGSRLSSQARVDDQTFTYQALREPIVNAFATFGGFICINSGLILITEDEAQLASVMAHETGHVVQHHMARAVAAESRMSLASTAALLAAIQIGAASGAGGQAIEGAIAMSQGIALQQSINFTRSQEIEADAVGIQLLAGAGFDPQEMATFFESLSRVEGLSEGEIPALLQDHPVTSERIATARARASQMTRSPPQPESASYSFIKERVRVLVTPPEARPQLYYASLRDHRALTPAERYGEALLQMQDGHAASAVRTLTELQATYPQMTMLYSALGQALAAAGQTDASLALFERSSRLFPRNVPLTVRYAETLMHTGHAQQAHQILLDLFNNVEPSPPQIRLTALAASAAGDPGDAYYYMAQYDLAGGNLPLANQQLELALAAPNLSAIQRARFRAQLDEVRGWLREQQASHRR